MSSYWDIYRNDISIESEYQTEKKLNNNELKKRTDQLINKLENSGSDVIITFNKNIVPIKDITDLFRAWENK